MVQLLKTLPEVTWKGIPVEEKVVIGVIVQVLDGYEETMPIKIT